MSNHPKVTVASFPWVNKNDGVPVLASVAAILHNMPRFPHSHYDDFAFTVKNKLASVVKVSIDILF